MKPSLTKNNYFPYILLLIQPVFMSTNTIIARGAVEFVPPISLAFWRWFTVFIILFPFFFSEIINKKKELKKESFKLLFLGSMGCGVCGAFPFIAGMTTTMANIGIIYTSSPVIIFVLSFFLFNEKPNLLKIFGLIVCILGVFIIISKGNINLFLNLNFTSGDIWVFGAAVGWALYSIYLLNWNSKFSIMARFTIISMFGFITLSPFFLIENFYFAKTNYNQNFLFWVLFAAISPSIIAFSLHTRLQRYLGASLAGFGLYLFAVYGAIFGIIIFEEPLLNFHYVGGALVFLGVYLAKRKNKT